MLISPTTPADFCSLPKVKKASPKINSASVALPQTLYSIYNKGGSEFYRSALSNMPLKTKLNSGFIDGNPIVQTSLSSAIAGKEPTSFDWDFDDEEGLSYENPVFEEFTNRKNRITLDEYLDIKFDHPEIIQQAQDYIYDKKLIHRLDQRPHDTARFAHDIKKYFDKKYGEDDYTIVSIGTSPAIVTEGLAACGSNVVFLPLTGVHKTYSNCGKNIDFFLDDYPKTKVVCNYIKEALENQNGQFKDKSKIILLDYKSSGDTLDFVQDVFVKYCNVPQDMVEKIDIRELAKKFYGKNSDISDNICLDMGMHNVESYANTPHYFVYCSAKDLERRCAGASMDKILETEECKYKELENYSTPLARAYQLLVLDELCKIYAAE